MRRTLVLSVTAAVLSACASAPDAPDEVVSVQYDPNRFQMSTLQRAAEAQCRAKGYGRAEPMDNAPNTESVRWSYLTFGCFKG